MVGAAGSICSALSRKIAEQKPKKLLLLDNNETGLFDICEELKDKCKVEPILGDIKDRAKLDETFNKYKPEIVFHGAAYKHVVMCEKWPLEAIKTNIGGTNYLVEFSQKYNVNKFIFISSDKAANPVSVMGKTKKKGEEICLKANGKTKFIVVRFGNVMASRGSVIEVFKKQIEEGKPLTITHKLMERYFMGLYEAVDLILKASHLGKGGEIFILDMKDKILIENLAKMMIKISGKDLGIVYTGKKQGEKLKEILMTPFEKRRSVKINGMWIIKNEKNKKSKTKN